MPYPSEHAARQNDPGKYVRFRRGNDKGGKGIDFIWGITKDGTVEIQSIRFDASKFTVEEAKKWLKEHDFKTGVEPAKKAEGTADDDLEFEFSSEMGSVTIEAAGSGEGSPKLPSFTMLAYTGNKMDLLWWRYPVVVDLQGMDIPSQKRPVRLQHDPTSGIGHTESIKVEGNPLRTLIATGIISRDTEEAREVVASAKRGFPWQASIGAKAKEGSVELVEEDVKRIINGREHEGPFYHVKRSTLGEISFVDLGADGDTQVDIAARFMTGKEHSMEETPEQKAAREKKEAEEKAAEEKRKLEAAAHPATPPPASPPPPPITPPASAIRAEAAAEVQRIDAIQKICGITHPDILAKAISEVWSVEKAELAILRADRPKPVTASSSGLGDNPGLVLEAAAVMSVRSSLSADPAKIYKPEILEAAHRAFRGQLGLYEMLIEAARANGFTGRGTRDMKQILAYAFTPQICASGFSTIDISGILSNIANKFLLEGFNFVEQAWRLIAARRNVKDFKTVTSYRLTGAEIYEEVNPAGEIKHGTLGEESFENRADTYGLMLAITRKDLINDDLGAISAVPRKLGRGAALKINQVFWQIFLDDAAFFTVADGNLLFDTPMTIDGITAAEIAFMALKDPDGLPIGHIPTLMLVPPALNARASQLMRSLELRQLGAAQLKGTGFGEEAGAAIDWLPNPHAGKFSVALSRYLTNPAAWYIFCNPADFAAIEVCFLNGKEEPTVETADADFNTLGIQMRGFHDFGVALQDQRAGIKCNVGSLES